MFGGPSTAQQRHANQFGAGRLNGRARGNEISPAGQRRAPAAGMASRPRQAGELYEEPLAGRAAARGVQPVYTAGHHRGGSQPAPAQRAPLTRTGFGGTGGLGAASRGLRNGTASHAAPSRAAAESPGAAFFGAPDAGTSGQQPTMMGSAARRVASETGINAQAGAPSAPSAAKEKVVNRDPRNVHRAMSVLSQEAMDALLRTQLELGGLEAKAEEVAARLQRHELTPGQARTELAQVEAAAHKVECDKVDSIYTSELQSGKDMAKTEKKEQLGRLERLFERLEVLFKWIKEVDAAQAAI
mmetsp:Transcript_124639/g.202699  ORF Transcript_124639/g.202699 Transcript_124639/m.202699 type:complete len:300 (-) Transcript_124639:167-1066(-)